MRTRLVVDLDDTLASFMDSWLAWLLDNDYTTEKLSLSDVASYDWMVKNFGSSCTDFFMKDPIYTYQRLIKPYPGAIEFHEWCNDNFDVEIVTHASNKDTVLAKTDFVKHYFGLGTKIRFFDVLEEKYQSTSKAILVDDYPLHCIKHLSINKMPSIIFDYQKGNGWSKIWSYGELLTESNIHVSKLQNASSYEDLKILLEDLI